MSDRGKSLVSSAIQVAHTLKIMEDWNLEARREAVEQMEKTLGLGHPSGDWSAFISRAVIGCAQERDLVQSESLSLSPDSRYFACARSLFAIAFGVPVHLL